MSKVQSRSFPYFGNKTRLMPWINTFINDIDHTNYVSVFGGSCSDILNKPISRNEWYNDLDFDLINFFVVLRDKRKEFLNLLKYTPYEELSLNPYPENELYKALYFYRSKIQFRGSSFRLKGNLDFTGGNVPIRYWNNKKILVQSSQRLKNVIICNRDCFDLIDNLDNKETLFYLDPPYLVETRKSKIKYNYDIDSIKWHIKLARKLKRIKGKFIISHYNCELYDRLYRDYQREDKETMDDGKNKRIESIWIKN